MTRRRTLAAACCTAAMLVMSAAIRAPSPVSFPTSDGGTIHALVYGSGPRAVVLAHGGQFNKESWSEQAQALERAGFRVLAFDFRGYGNSTGPGQADVFTAPLELDVLAAVRYLRLNGATSIAAVGGSMGGGVSAAVAEQEPAVFDRLVLLGSETGEHPEKLRVPTLFIVARDDANADGPRLPRIRAQYERVVAPKEIVILEEKAHAQFLFRTNQAGRVMSEILRFLGAR